jgi:MFS family permease
MLFLINSSSCFLGYLRIQRNVERVDGNKSIKRISVLRSVLVILPLLIGIVPLLGIAVSIVTLVGMGLAYAFYSVAVLSLSMEVIPQGKAGLFTALIGTGAAVGCFVGPLIAENVGFEFTFVTSAVFFVFSFIAFQKFS